MKIGKTKSSFIIASCLLLILLMVFNNKISAGKEGMSYLYSIDSYGIHRLDVNSNTEQIIFNTEGIYGVTFSLSPSDTIIALLLTERGITPPGEYDYSVLPKNSMMFIDVDGNELMTFDKNVRRFSWSPDGEKLAYIAGTYNEDGDVGFKVTEVGIFDLKDKSETRIKKDFPHKTLRGNKGGEYKIMWARHDNNIYIQEFDFREGVYRYNTKAGISEKVPYNGIHFSPDGRYYLAFGPIESSPQLCSIIDNKNFIDNLPKDLGNLSGWIFNTGHYLLFTKADVITETEGDGPVKHVKSRKVTNEKLFIYDPEQRKVVKKFDGSISSWVGNGNQIIVERDGKIIFEGLP